MTKRISGADGVAVDARYARAGGLGDDESVFPRWVGYRVDWRALVNTGATGSNATVDLFTAPIGTVVHDVAVKLETGFDAAVTLSDAVLEVGDEDDDDGYLAGLANQDDAGGTTGYQTVDLADLGPYLKNDIGTTPAVDESEPKKVYAAEKVFKAKVTLTGDTIDDLTQGSVVVFLRVSNAEAAAIKDLS